MKLQRDFLEVMRETSASVWILANCYQADNQAITVSSFTSVSIDPPTILCCINKQAAINQTISQRDSLFSANLLTDSQQDLAILCSDTQATDQRFKHRDWNITLENNNPPYLEKTVASIICRTIKATDINTHTLIIANVQTVIATKPISSPQPLVYHNGKFGIFST